MPTAAGLEYFRVLDAGEGQVALSWRTLVEYDLIGFHVERSNGTGGWEKVTPGIIPSTGSTLQPQSYGFTSVSVPGSHSPTYRLVEVDLRGQEHVIAEAMAGAELTGRISTAADGLNLDFELQGKPKLSVTVQASTSVQGPWMTVQSLTLDDRGRAVVNLERDLNESARFFRVVAE